MIRNKIFIYSGPGVGKDSLLHTQSTLQRIFNTSHSIETILPTELIERNWEKDTALLVIPGGADIPYTHRLNGKGNSKIKAYVQNGGIFLGICAGSYFGGRKVEFALGTSLEVVGDRELSFFPGTVIGPTLAPYNYRNSSGSQSIRLKLKDGSSSPFLFYHGGGSFVDANRYSSVEILAFYEHGDQEMAAIVKCKVGEGNALLSAVHFEFDPLLMDFQNPYLQSVIFDLQKSEEDRIGFITSLFREVGL